jgi:uncharacterized protein DUF5678
MIGTDLDRKHEAPSRERSAAARIRELLEHDQIEAARALLAAALPHDRSGELASLGRLLAPPRVRKSAAKDVDRLPEFGWLEAHGQEYSGQWVAVEGDRLLAHSSSLKELLAVLRETAPSRPPLVHHLE